MWNVLECGGSGREKRGKKEKRKEQGYVCGGEKKRGKKEGKKKEIWMKKNKKQGKNKIKNKKLKLRNAITIFLQ